MKKSFLPTSEFVREPYCNILGYPRFTKRQIKSRIKELESLGVVKVAFWGQVKVGSLDVLGKGYVGIVVLGRYKNKTVAIKIRRTDSQRSELKSEAKLLQLVNKIKVGPKFVAANKNFLVMEYLNGQRIGHWVKEKRSIKELKKVLRKILGDCRKLDAAGIDHGELSNISKHVIIGKKITMIDYESSSTKRRTSNVTSAAQSIFIGSGIAKKISNSYRVNTKQNIISGLRKYKKDRTDKSFEDLLKVLKLW